MHIAAGMLNTHVKFGGNTIQIGSDKSNQIPSPGMVNLLLLLWRFLSNNELPIIMPCSHLYHRFMKLLVYVDHGMVNGHGKFDGDSIQIGSHRSNQFPSPGMVNLLLLLLRFLSNNGLPITMPLIALLSQVYEIAGAHSTWHGQCPW